MKEIIDFKIENEYEHKDNRALRTMEFNLYEDDFERVYLCMYPRDSKVHGFETECPTSYDNYYKTYFYFEVRQIAKNFCHRPNTSLYFDGCDECSPLPSFTMLLKDHIVNGKDLEGEWIGGFGTSWYITKLDVGSPEQQKDGYWFYMFDHDDKSFRFFLKEDKIVDLYNFFAKFLIECIEHSVPC